MPAAAPEEPAEHARHESAAVPPSRSRENQVGGAAAPSVEESADDGEHDPADDDEADEWSRSGSNRSCRCRATSPPRAASVAEADRRGRTSGGVVRLHPRLRRSSPCSLSASSGTSSRQAAARSSPRESWPRRRRVVKKCSRLRLPADLEADLLRRRNDDDVDAADAQFLVTLFGPATVVGVDRRLVGRVDVGGQLRFRGRLDDEILVEEPLDFGDLEIGLRLCGRPLRRSRRRRGRVERLPERRRAASPEREPRARPLPAPGTSTA